MNKYREEVIKMTKVQATREALKWAKRLYEAEMDFEYCWSHGCEPEEDTETLKFIERRLNKLWKMVIKDHNQPFGIAIV